MHHSLIRKVLHEEGENNRDVGNNTSLSSSVPWSRAAVEAIVERIYFELLFNEILTTIQKEKKTEKKLNFF